MEATQYELIYCADHGFVDCTCPDRHIVGVVFHGAAENGNGGSNLEEHISI